MCAGLCPTLWDPMDDSPPGFFVHKFFQAGVLEWTIVLTLEDLPNPETEPMFPESPALAGRSVPLVPPGT